ncbi:MAG: hypothetical protein KAV87_56085, partial [Desulfobacteraceae bacterium]|nr:hypothetical protein [Desulfobacteraceae bacterium]
MKKEDLKDIFEKASEIASVVPEVMQPVAFNQAVELLLGQPPSGEKGDSKTGKRKATRRIPKYIKKEKKENIVKDIINKLDRTKYPHITKFT